MRHWVRAGVPAVIAGALLLANSPATFAAVNTANPYAGLGPMILWAWGNPGNSPEVVFDFGGNYATYAFDVHVPAAVSNHWGGIDNPAALIWYYHHVSATNLGQSVFGPGVLYTPALVKKMKAEHFAPSLVGGYNPPDLGSPPPVSTPPASPRRPHPRRIR